MRRLLKDPLLHFAVAGALLFAAHAWLNPSASTTDASREIHIGPGEVNWLEATWRGQTGREPTAGELRELVSNLVREEVLAREARELRLDENDTIVRRRLAQKLEFMLQDTVRIAEPSDEELRRFYRASPQPFLTEPRISFEQIYFSPERRKEAVAALKEPTPALLGDRSMLQSHFVDAEAREVTAAFGPGFAARVFALRPGAWQGPIESGYGVHLVRVTAIEPARLRDFTAVRALVLERWRAEQQRAAEARYLARLTAKYPVVIDK